MFSEVSKLNMVLASIIAQRVNIIEDKTGEIKKFISIRKAVKYIYIYIIHI
jgi:hypothetical protein